MPHTRLGQGLKRNGGFTLVELLIVILIIAVLVSILIPTVSKVRTAAWVANTKNQISQIEGACQRYYGDQHQYPGPLDNAALYTQERGHTAPQIYDANGGAVIPRADHITQAENLVLGLFGGLKWTISGSAFKLCFDPDQIGRGMIGMNPASPSNKKYAPYLDDVKMLSPAGKQYQDNSGQADDSGIPEILDKFPSGMPILYFRAHPGTKGVARFDMPESAVPAPRQYDMSDVYAYTRTNTLPGVGDVSIGEGKKISLKDYVTGVTFGSGYKGPTQTMRPHGLQDAIQPNNQPCSIIKGQPGYTFPYDGFAYLRDPSTPLDAVDNLNNTPRRKDTFILISPGADRVYGTSDDICNFGDVLP